mmetsp:Transcript_5095/g.6923  ORF Transcript_5095/g.6923 Transcript_5095/m.6923 type:complete len:364 (-) Transcript_5095:56-1147(-)
MDLFSQRSTTVTRKYSSTKNICSYIFLAISLVVSGYISAHLIHFKDPEFIKSLVKQAPDTVHGSDLPALLSPTVSPPSFNSSILVMYSYFEGSSKESNTNADLARTNLEYFIKVGVLGPTSPDRQQATFVFIINGGHVSVHIPEHLSNVHVLKRNNFGLEFCGVKEALEKYNRHGFTHYIMLNSSIRGPFLPNYVRFRPWTDSFINMITSDVKLVGTSINCYCNPCAGQAKLDTLHLQSFFLATDVIGMEIIQKKMICTNHKVTAVLSTELGMSQAVLTSGFNLGSNLQFWQGHDFRKLEPTLLKCAQVLNNNMFGGDVMFRNAYFGLTVHPLEVIFTKVNRKGMADFVERYSSWNLDQIKTV